MSLAIARARGYRRAAEVLRASGISGFKGMVMAAFGVGVLLEVVLKVVRGSIRAADLMGESDCSRWPPTSDVWSS